MIFSDVQRNRAIEVFTANPYWEGAYKNAPSDACREVIAFEWCYSLNCKEIEGKSLKEELLSEGESLEKKLGRDDWRHLLKYAGNTPLADKCESMIRGLSE